MSELSERLAYTEEPLYGYVANEPSTVDFTWQIPALFVAGGLINKGRGLLTEYAPYLNDIWQGRSLLFHKPFDKMTKDEFKQYGNLGEEYYQNHLQKNPVNIQNYGEIKFNRKNKGKDITQNYEQYPFLRKNLETSKKEELSSNNKNEADRIYDYFTNSYKNNPFEYIIENIAGVGKRYKMMKNKNNK